MKLHLHRFLTWRFMRLAALSILILNVLLWSVLIVQWLGGHGTLDSTGVPLGPDFMAFYTGTSFVTHGQSAQLYDLAAQERFQQSLGNAWPGVSGFVNPPQWAVLLAPLGWLPYRWAFALWTLLMVACFGTSVLLLRDLLPALRPRWWAAATLALGAAPVYFATTAGQNTALSLLLHVAVAWALVHRRDALAGVLIALGCYKPQLFLPLLPLLVLDRRWRVIAAALAMLALVVVVAWLSVGTRGFAAWIDILSSTLVREQQRQASKLFSWQPFWTLLLGQNAIGVALGWIAAALTALVLAWYWLQPTADPLLRIALTVLGLMLISPHLFVYDLGLLILPGLVLADRTQRPPLARRSRTQALQAVLLVLYISLFFYEQVLYTHIQLPVLLMAVLLGLGLRYAWPQPAPQPEAPLTPVHR